MADFQFIDAKGAPVQPEGYFFRDFFDCDIETADAEELSTHYRGPDCDGIGVKWTTQ